MYFLRTVQAKIIRSNDIPSNKVEANSETEVLSIISENGTAIARKAT